MSFTTKTATLFRTIRTVKNWPTVVHRQLLDRSLGVCQIAFRNGLNIAYRPAAEDWEAVKEVMFDGVYKFTLEYLSTHKEALPILDLGANIGLFTLRAAQCASKSALHAYEPAPKNFALLAQNHKLNAQLSRLVHLHTEAVGGHSRLARFYFDEQATQASRVMAKPDEQGGIPVSVRGLAEIMREIPGECALIKIDVEGAEFEIFQDTPSEIWARVRAISMEIHRDPARKRRAADLLKQIESLGFNCTKEFSGANSYFFQRNTRKPSS